MLPILSETSLMQYFLQYLPTSAAHLNHLKDKSASFVSILSCTVATEAGSHCNLQTACGCSVNGAMAETLPRLEHISSFE